MPGHKVDMKTYPAMECPSVKRIVSLQTMSWAQSQKMVEGGGGGGGGGGACSKLLQSMPGLAGMQAQGYDCHRSFI